MKKQKRTLYFLVSGITVIAALIFLHTLVNATVYVPDSGSLGVVATETPVATPTGMVSASASASVASVPVTLESPAKAAYIPATYPVRLTIPSLKIDAAVQRLGLTAKGALGSPNNFTDVGWYAAGTIPGNMGSAIIDGHVDNGLALAGVFKHLSDIAIGDNVYVTNEGGTMLHFIVTDIESYDYQNAPTDMIFNQSNGIFLKLITCNGTWVPAGRTYDRRIVVTAVLAK